MPASRFGVSLLLVNACRCSDAEAVGAGAAGPEAAMPKVRKLQSRWWKRMASSLTPDGRKVLPRPGEEDASGRAMRDPDRSRGGDAEAPGSRARRGAVQDRRSDAPAMDKHRKSRRSAADAKGSRPCRTAARPTGEPGAKPRRFCGNGRVDGKGSWGLTASAAGPGNENRPRRGGWPNARKRPRPDAPDA